MQPLAALQQLVVLKFTCSEYGAATELPAAAAAALSRLEVLDASGCAPVAAAGDLQCHGMRYSMSCKHVSNLHFISFWSTMGIASADCYFTAATSRAATPVRPAAAGGAACAM
jgi:hypothetical protein